MTTEAELGQNLGIWTAFGWLGLVLVQYYALWILSIPVLWLVAYPVVWWLSWIPAIVLSLRLLLRLGRRPLLVGVLATVMLATGVTVHKTNWEGVFARTYFTAHRSEFAEVAEMFRRDELELEPYYGGRLPVGLRGLSINGRAARFTSLLASDAPHGVFLPQWMGPLDGAIGFAYLPMQPPEGVAFDGFGDFVYVCARLGDGWYWAGYRKSGC